MDACHLKRIPRVNLTKRHVGKVLALLLGVAACIEPARPAIAPHGNAAYMIAMLVGKNQSAHILLRKPQLMHALYGGAAREAVVNHDETLWSFNERAVAFRPRGQNV